MLGYYRKFLIAKIVNFYIGLKLVLTKKQKTDIFIMYGIVTDIFIHWPAICNIHLALILDHMIHVFMYKAEQQ